MREVSESVSKLARRRGLFTNSYSACPAAVQVPVGLGELAFPSCGHALERRIPTGPGSIVRLLLTASGQWDD
jgi:hypothetical protein